MKPVSRDIISDFFLDARYRKARYILSISVLMVITISMILNNVYYLDNAIYIIAEWIVYSGVTFGIVLINISVLIPRYLLKGRIVAYFITVLIMVFVCLTIIGCMQSYVFSGEEIMKEMTGVKLYGNLVSSIISMGFFIIGSSVIQLFRYWIKSNKRINELESATLQSELELLKGQINPHFLFNMLNNANVLIWKNKEEAQRVLYKLEALLRYQFNEASKEKILLTFDIRFLNDFLNLEKIRRDNFEYKIINEGNINEVWIPSLLFIPFVENAIKHNSDSHHFSYVYLYFKVESNQLMFRCENSKPIVAASEKRFGGLGLKNIQRRLALLYPDRHTLIIDDETDRYIVSLKLEIE